MRTTRISILTLAAFVSMSTCAVPQDIPLKGRSCVELNVGFWSGRAANTVGGTGIHTEAKLSGFVGGLTYSYGLEELWSLTVSSGLVAAQASSDAGILGVEQQASTVITLFLGIRYYLNEPSDETKVRPYLSGAVGPFFGSEAKNSLSGQVAHSETAAGGRIGAGVDFFISPHFKLGIDAGYDLMANFDTPIGARKNYNGIESVVKVGYVF